MTMITMKTICGKRFTLKRVTQKPIFHCDFCGSKMDYIPYHYEGFEICDKCNLRYKN